MSPETIQTHCMLEFITRGRGKGPTLERKAVYNPAVNSQRRCCTYVDDAEVTRRTQPMVHKLIENEVAAERMTISDD